MLCMADSPDNVYLNFLQKIIYLVEEINQRYAEHGTFESDLHY